MQGFQMLHRWFHQRFHLEIIRMSPNNFSSTVFSRKIFNNASKDSLTNSYKDFFFHRHRHDFCQNYLQRFLYKFLEGYFRHFLTFWNPSGIIPGFAQKISPSILPRILQENPLEASSGILQRFSMIFFYGYFVSNFSMNLRFFFRNFH